MPERFSLGSLALAAVDLVLLYCFQTIHLRVLGHFVAPVPGVYSENLILNSYWKGKVR